MRVLSIVHERDAGPGVFADSVRAAGAELEEWFVPEGQAPRPLAEYGAAMVFGGSMHADQDQIHPWLATERAALAELLDRRTPLLGVCLGAQLLAQAAGGGAVRSRHPEIGWFPVEPTATGAADPVLGVLGDGTLAFEWHSYEVELPTETTVLARSETCVQAYRVGAALGIQFHAEVSAADAATWIADYRDPDAERIGVDRAALADETKARIGAWNELGRALCARWLAASGA